MEKCYIINYDLNKAKDYKSLFDAIESYGTYVKILESCWAITTTKSAIEVRDHLLSVMDSDDGILVVKSGYEAAWMNVECSNEWLQKKI
ncbi:hypothetical protein [Olivibacter sp. SDN3]|uniref:hypothetical protein n=1 Tax=Olivibacter sp. SDN3 TaxID=2764720 RepID=UPI001C9E6092|nr:hypothetical protein [Olivibacter sp. SDN3]